jgi:hypothetical protein
MEMRRITVKPPKTDETIRSTDDVDPLSLRRDAEIVGEREELGDGLGEFVLV